MDTQSDYVSLCRQALLQRMSGRRPLAYVHTYGCQANVADSERVKGLLSEIGYDFCDEKSMDRADLILFNTCAVREHAEDRVFGNVGALKKYKEDNPNLIIVLCGCMVQQSAVAEKIKKSYSFVDLIFGTFALQKFPELLFGVISSGRHMTDISEDDTDIPEGLPVCRDRDFKAWLPIMYGCNNFCTYCIVPYVRGRERSRSAQAVLDEARSLVRGGAKDITLLGQNVNSYGKGTDVNFSALLRLVNDIDGDFIIRFMTSHPKDCTHELIDTLASCSKAAHHLHLPFQSGSNRVLSAMNRGYTREKYLDLISYARSVIPDLSITSDVIVGFPNETEEEFLETLSLIKEVRFTSLFTFIYSPRPGTKAALIDDKVTYHEKTERFAELLKAQEEIASARSASMAGGRYKVLVEEKTRDKPGYLMGRTGGNISIDFEGTDDLIGSFRTVEVTQARNWLLTGKLI